MSFYKPEGHLIDTPENKAALKSIASLQDAFVHDRILEARAWMCDSSHNLIIDFGFAKGIIPRNEGALGIEDGTTRDIAIISKVNKPVCFKITGFSEDESGKPMLILSRRLVQQHCQDKFISRLTSGDVIDVRVSHLEPFGCFVDIGCGIASLIPIDCISVSRISHPSDRFRVGQDIKAVVKSVELNGRVTLSHKELLGTWAQNAALFFGGETVAGVVRSVEDYGVFVELTPNLAGLAEPKPGIAPGQHASVYIKSLIPERMKVKLIIVDAFDAKYPPSPPVYFIKNGHIDHWRYSPDESERVIETVFADLDYHSGTSQR